MLADFNNSFTVRTRNYFCCNFIAVNYHLSLCYTIDELKQRLIEVWCGLEQSTVDMAILLAQAAKLPIPIIRNYTNATGIAGSVYINTDDVQLDVR